MKERILDFCLKNNKINFIKSYLYQIESVKEAASLLSRFATNGFSEFLFKFENKHKN